MICLEGNKKEIRRDWERINIPSIKKLYYRSYEMFGLERDTGPTRIRVCGNPWILSYLHLVWGETLVPHVRVLGVRCFFFCAGEGGGGWGVEDGVVATQHSPPPPPLLSYVLSLDLQRKIFIYVIIKYLCIHEAAKSILDHTKAYKPIRSFCSLKTYVMLLLLLFFHSLHIWWNGKEKGPPKLS